MELFAANGKIYQKTSDGGVEVQLKGLNWFGFETDIYVVHGIWQRNMESILDWIKSQGFNILRIPFSTDFALNPDGKQPVNPSSGDPAIDYWSNPSLKGLSSGGVLDSLVQSAGQRGILICFDMHCLVGGQPISDLWYDSNTPESSVILGWKNIASRYAGSWNVVAADIKNEPHGGVTWGSGSVATDFNLFCERAGNAILEVNPKLLIFVEGLHKYGEDHGCWGACLQGVTKHPVQLSIPNKVVYSSHIYGFHVAKTKIDQEAWERRFGFITSQNLGTLVVGEWGGDVPDYDFLTAFTDWMVAKGLCNNFHRCLNPNSGDTKGVLGDDWVTPVDFKLELI